LCVADRKIGYRLLGSALRLFGSRADRLFLSFLPRSRGGGAPVPHLPSARCLLRAPLFLVPPSLSSGRFLLPALFYPESALAFRPGWSRLVCPRIWSVHMHCSLSPFPLERVCVCERPQTPRRSSPRYFAENLRETAGGTALRPQYTLRSPSDSLTLLLVGLVCVCPCSLALAMSSDRFGSTS